MDANERKSRFARPTDWALKPIGPSNRLGTQTEPRAQASVTILNSKR